jgi:hypothetical protein
VTAQQIFAMGGGGFSMESSPALDDYVLSLTRLIREGMPAGLAADDGVGLHFVDGALHRVVRSREHARAYRVESIDGEVREQPLELG